MFHNHLYHDRIIHVRQRKELNRLLEYGARNKYEITTIDGLTIGIAAEEEKSLSERLERHFLGRWRSFNIHIFDSENNLLYRAFHPFRFFFKRIELQKSNGQNIGALQQCLGLFYKRFDLVDANGMKVMKMSAPLWSPWVFPIFKGADKVAVIKKEWRGFFVESFTNADNFSIEFQSNKLSEIERELILTCALFIDLTFFANHTPEIDLKM